MDLHDNWSYKLTADGACYGYPDPLILKCSSLLLRPIKAYATTHVFLCFCSTPNLRGKPTLLYSLHKKKKTITK